MRYKLASLLRSRSFERSVMNIYKLIGRNLEISEAMKRYAEEKLARLNRFSDQIIDTKVVISYATNGNSAAPAKVEVQVNVPSGIVRAGIGNPTA